MYQRKTPKLQLPDKNEYTLYNPHTIDLKERKYPDVVKVISIDPGIRNLALRVESRGITSSNYPIKTIVFEKLKITDADRKLEGNVDQLYFLLTEFLDGYRDIFKECHMLIIERQLPINYKAVRISQHIITYFLILFKDRTPHLPVIYEVDPKLKGRELGASKHLNERGIKQWSVDFGKALLTKRGDYDALNVLQKNKAKSDDLSDVVVQAEAFFSFQGWPLTTELATLNVKKAESIKENEVSKGAKSKKDSLSSTQKTLPVLAPLAPLPPNPLVSQPQQIKLKIAPK